MNLNHLIFALYIMHFAVNLERILYVNEFFSLIGIILLIKRGFGSRRNTIDMGMMLFMLISVLPILAGYLYNGYPGIYYYFRTSTILYSAFSYYVGRHLFVESFFINKKKVEKIYEFILLCAAILVGPLLTFFSFTIIYFRKYNGMKRGLKLIIAIVIFKIIIDSLSLFDDEAAEGFSSTAIVQILVLVISYLMMQSKIRLKLISFYAVVALIFFMIVLSLDYVYEAFRDFYSLGFSVFGDSGDNNAYWRALFWAKTVHDLSPFQLITGIGIGSPIFNENDALNGFIVATDPDAVGRPYTLGLHNSFLTMYVRMGLISFMIFMYINCYIYVTLFNSSKDSKTSATLLSIYVMLLVSMLFNVILESPLYGAIYWVFIGVVAGYVQNMRIKKLGDSHNKVGEKNECKVS